MRKALLLVAIISLPSPAFAYTVMGNLVSGATGLDSEYTTWSNTVAPGAWRDCTNEAVEIGSSGVYSLTLTDAEMDAPYVAVQIKSNEASTVLLIINNSSDWLGAGDNATTINLVNGNDAPIPSASICIKNTAENVTYVRTLSDINGQATVGLANGVYHIILAFYGSYIFTVPEILTVDGATSVTYSGTRFVPDAPTTPNLCGVYGWLYGFDGTPSAGKMVSAKLRPEDYPAAYDYDGDGVPDWGVAFAKTADSTVTDSNGYWMLYLTHSAKILHIPSNTETRYRFVFGEAGITHSVSVPSTSTVKWDSLAWEEE